MLALGEAVARVVRGVGPLPPERVRLDEAYGRVLAEDVRAPLTLPPLDNSAMDGYAVRGADVRSATLDAPAVLRVVGTAAAGGAPAPAIHAGEAVRIMTGAPVPAGADCVVRVEDTDGGTDRVAVRSARDVGRHVRPRGEDVVEGDLALEAGTPLRGAQLALLAALGATTVDVGRVPRVAILGSGDELVPPELARDAAADGRIVASNAHALRAHVRRDGGAALDLGIAPDDPDAIAALARDAEPCDALVTTAGASVGAFDHTQRALAALGLDLDFWRVRVRPGAQTAFGRLRALADMPWLGLPGNPASAQVTYELFVRPLLLTLQGHRAPFRATVAATLDEPAHVAGAGFVHLLRVVMRIEDGHARVRLAGAQGSGLLRPMAHANALLVGPPDGGELRAGERVRVLPLDDALATAAVPW